MDILSDFFGSENDDRKQVIMRLGSVKIQMNTCVLIFQNENWRMEVAIQKQLQIEYKVYWIPDNILLLHHNLRNPMSRENTLEFLYRMATRIVRLSWPSPGRDDVASRSIAREKVNSCLNLIIPDDVIDMTVTMDDQYKEAFNEWTTMYGYAEMSFDSDSTLWYYLIRFATRLRSDIRTRTLSLDVLRPGNCLKLHMKVNLFRSSSSCTGKVHCLAVWNNEHWLKLRIGVTRGMISSQLKEFFQRCMLLQEELFSIGTAGLEWENWDEFQTTMKRVVASLNDIDILEEGNVEALGRHFGTVRGVEEVMEKVNDVIVYENLVLITKEYAVGCILTLEFKRTPSNRYHLKWTMQFNEDYAQDHIRFDDIYHSRPMEEWFQMILIMSTYEIDTASDVPWSLVQAISNLTYQNL